MRGRLSRLRPTPAVLISAIAVFLAIGGIGYAATKIGTNQLKKGAVTKPKLHGSSVGSGKLEKGAVTKPKLDGSSVGSGKVIDHSLQCQDLKNGCVQGPPGPKGDQGIQGPPGQQGPPGAGHPFEQVLGLDQDAAPVAAGTTTLNVSSNGSGVCGVAYMHLTENVYYQVFRFAPGTAWSGSATGTLLAQAQNNAATGRNGIDVAAGPEGMWKVIASPQDGTGGVSVYEFTLDTEHVPGDGTGCYFQGESVG